MVGWHHQPYGHEFEQALGVGDGQEAWYAAVYGVARSQTQLSELNGTDSCFLKKEYFLTSFLCSALSLYQVV